MQFGYMTTLAISVTGYRAGELCEYFLHLHLGGITALASLTL